MNPFKMFRFNPVLSDYAIRKRIEKGELLEKMPSEQQFQPNSVDLTLADTWRAIQSNDTVYNGLYQEEVIDPTKPIEYIEGRMEEDPSHNGRKTCLLEPGEFVLFASREVLTIPNGIVAFVQGRSSIARLGIQTEQAGLIDSGFRGTITFEVYNETEYPIYLMEGMRVAQVYFFKAMASEKLYGKDHGSKYSNQIEATGSKINQDPELQ